MSRTIRIEHLGRVEGHGGITVELDGDALREVRFDVFEGLRLLEALVRGRSWEDVAQIVSRICAICSAVHAIASIEATEAAFGVEPSARTRRLRDLLLRGENIASHSLHLFLLAAPDYLGYPSAPAMATDHPGAVALGLRLKRLGNRIQEVVGGRAIHPVNAVPGGFGRAPEAADLAELARALELAREDARAAVEFVAGLPDRRLAAAPLDLAALEPRSGYGYAGGDRIVFRSAGERLSIPATDLVERTSERAVSHSHAKHSTFAGRPFMVGALARVALFGDRLSRPARDAATTLGLERAGGSPLENNAAQAVEIVEDVEAALAIVCELLDSDAGRERPLPVVPRSGVGTSVLEAPRGLLLHRYEYDASGRIVAADVRTPTALNAASVEERFRMLVADDPRKPEPQLKLDLEMIARAYDPCISCSVHLVRRRAAR